jgi:hypothetical protein
MGSSATLAAAFVDLGLQTVKRSRFPGEMGVGMGRLGSLTALLGALLLASMASTAGAAPLIDRFHGTLSVTFSDTRGRAPEEDTPVSVTSSSAVLEVAS